MPHAEIRKWTLTFTHVEALSKTSWFCRGGGGGETSFGYKFVLLTSTSCNSCTGRFCVRVLNSGCCPVLQAELRNMTGLVKRGHASVFIGWPETGAVFPRSHSDETASLSVERECARERTHTFRVSARWPRVCVCVCVCATPGTLIHVRGRMRGIPHPHSL